MGSAKSVTHGAPHFQSALAQASSPRTLARSSAELSTSSGPKGAPRARRGIGIALFSGAEELDWAGPWEVLSYWARTYPDDGVDVFTVGEAEGPVTCARGLRVLPDYTWNGAPPIDVLVYPGGRGTGAQIGSATITQRLRQLASHGTLMASVCTGALVFADAGLLDNRAATTHWNSLDELSAIGPSIEVRPYDRFVDSGDVITAAGVSAGIDMALHLVVRLQSVARAREVRRAIQYDPEPPV